MLCLATADFFTYLQLDVPLVLLGPGLNKMPDFSSVDFNTCAGDALNASCFQAKVIFDGPKETGNLHRWEAYSFDIMSH
jgi:hypothetical protein